jgi:hypothetical protein
VESMATIIEISNVSIYLYCSCAGYNKSNNFHSDFTI